MSFNYSPSSFGGSADHVSEIFLKALNQADGDAVSHEVDSFMYAENFAASRVISDLWSTNVRMTYQFDPNKMTDFLSRWENILNIIPDPDATSSQRRSVVKQKFSAVGQNPTQQVINDLLSALLGSVYVSILNNNYTTASGGVPGGESVPGGATLIDNDWYSSIAYIGVLITQPSSISDEKFYQTAGNIDSFLEDILPAWTTFAWIRNNSDDECGFILDDEHNLDNSYFCAP